MHAATLATGVLASGVSDNSPHGFNWTFAFPMILVVLVGVAIYLLYTRPHRVPGHGELRFTPETVTKEGSVPDPGAARAAAVASGFTTAAGGGAVESVAEPAGAHRAASAETESDTVAQDDDPALPDQTSADGPGAAPLQAAQKPPSDDPEASE